MLLVVRVGEAKVPGPASSSASQDPVQWTLGVVNPTGLQGKEESTLDLEPGLWAVSETHLTELGIHRFRKGLLRVKSPFSSFVPGAPLPNRPHSQHVGTFSGVGLLASFPSRALPQCWGEDPVSTGRIQATASLVHGQWVQGAVLYGYTPGPVFRKAALMTDQLLELAEDRIVFNNCGPRFVAGDFNLPPSHARFQAWQRAGFEEVQSVALQRWGIQPQMTCRMATQVDQLWVSPELARVLQSVAVHHDRFADHATVHAVFTGLQPEVVYRWPTPRPLPEVPKEACAPEQAAPAWCPATLAQAGDSYRSLWEAFEEQHALRVATVGGPSMPSRCRGRGSVLEPLVGVCHVQPLRPSRHGEVAPQFEGNHSMHRLWFTQLRRLQAYSRSVRLADTDPGRVENVVRTWSAIVRARGFAPSFAEWWHSRTQQCPWDPPCVPLMPPDAIDAKALSEALLREIRSLEASLNSDRVACAKARRKAHPALVFRDIARPRAKPVDLLVNTRRAQVELVDESDCAVVLVEPCEFRVDRPVWVAGKQYGVVHAEGDKIWLDSPVCAAVGQVVVQDDLVGNLCDVFDAFATEWRARWDRHRDVPDARWDPLIALASRYLPQVDATVEPITVPQFRKAIQSKHKHAATGADGVARSDLLQLSDSQLSQALHVFEGAERTGIWPQQLLVGIVNSLEKTEHASTAAQYRPIVVLSLVYRVWSSIRSRQLIRKLKHCLDPGLMGNVPKRHTAHIWYSVQSLVEAAGQTGEVLSGVVADVVKAFNVLPRLPIFAIAAAILWMDEILHHLETMRNHCSLVFTGES